MPLHDEKLKHRLNQVINMKQSAAREFTLCIQPADWSCCLDRDYYTYIFDAALDQEDPIINNIRDATTSLEQHPEHGKRTSDLAAQCHRQQRCQVLHLLPGLSRISRHGPYRNYAPQRRTYHQKNLCARGRKVGASERMARSLGR
jgi:hypothetical protein